MFSRTSPTLAVLNLSNRVLAREPFAVPYDDLNIIHKKRYRSGGGCKTAGQMSVKWTPEAKITITLSSADWIPESCKDVMRNLYPIYYNPDTDVFSIKTDKGNTFPQSSEHIVENLVHILWYSNKIATRDETRYHYDHHYMKHGMPLIFKYKENQWLDFKRMDNATKLWSVFREPQGTGDRFRQMGGYQPLGGPMKGKPFYQKLLQNDFPYNPRANYKMDPFSRDPAAAEKKMGSSDGIRWYK